MVAGVLLGAAVAWSVLGLSVGWFRQRKHDERVTYAESVTVSQEFWIPHGANESYRIDFPVSFATPPEFVGVPWPQALSLVPQTATKPDERGFTLVTARGYSKGDGDKGIRFSYTAKGRLRG